MQSAVICMEPKMQFAGDVSPDVKHWPPGDFIEVKCPSCGVYNDCQISIARRLGEYGRLDICTECNKDFVIEAYPDGVHVFECEAPL
jgi:hypothetical protein